MAATRRDVEQELELKSASIAGSLARIKKDLSFPTTPVSSALKEHPVEVVAGVVAAGLALGWLVAGKKKRKSAQKPPGGSNDDLAAAEFLHLVRAARASGLDEQEAVSRAMRVAAWPQAPSRVPAGRKITNRVTDHLVDMVDAVVRTALRVVVREAATWMAEAIRRDKSTDSS